MKTIYAFYESMLAWWLQLFSGVNAIKELAAILCCYTLAYVLVKYAKSHVSFFKKPNENSLSALHFFAYQLSKLLFPILVLVFLKITVNVLFDKSEKTLLIDLSLIIASLLFLYAVVDLLVKQALPKKVFLIVGMPILFFHLVGFLDEIIAVLDAMYIQIGNIRLSVYGSLRVVVFGSLLFWFGRLSNSTGKKLIRNQPHLDIRTKEVFSKIFEIFIFFIIFLLLLQVMGINLTTLAVFGGALGVGLGFGLQAIASNFISGVIILLDRSVSVNDYVELEDGRTGCVREMSLRSTTLETYDGKDIVVPNEKFITCSFVNWTHKDIKQRYRVDFSIAYDSDVRALVELIKDAVAKHPQVISGEKIPIEERPDCEIDSFGESGINMFVEFWMEGIDDGKNRVGGDLLLTILETIRENGYVIPFPQREIRIIKAR